MLLASFPSAPGMSGSHDHLMTRLVVEEGVLESVMTILSSLLPKSTALFQSFVPNLKELDTSSQAKTLVLNEGLHRALVKSVRTYAFTTYDDTLVMVPEGYHGHFVEHLTMLVRQGKDFSKNALKIVKDYNLELSMFLSNGDVRTSLKSYEQHYRAVKEDRLSHQKEHAIFVDTKNLTRSRLPLGALIERFGDLEQVFHLTEQLVSVYGDMQYKGLSDEVQKAADLLKLIRARIDSKEITAISGAMAKNLSTGAYEVARYVELMAMYGYYAESALSCSRGIAAKLAELFSVKS